MADDDVFCRQCGHRNPPGANFCSSCGAPLAARREDPTTVTFFPDAAETYDEMAVDYDEVPPGVGVLVVKRGPNVGSRFSLEKDLIQAGRHPESDIFLDDVTVSRRHAEIIREDYGYRVRDAGSLNGTYLNRQRVESAPLADGDELQIGTFKLVFLTGRGDAT
ncbi:MAG TPA: FHA domain-containing protein [Acidimicrobiales bacterium]|nr:FHA domain-containing protein [Acidimicrobiales bacterium]